MTGGRTSLPRPNAGYAVEGEAFYVWDEDPREARMTGESLRWADAAPDRARGIDDPPPDTSSA